jgi:hypothetical protein
MVQVYETSIFEIYFKTDTVILLYLNQKFEI